MSFMSMFRSKPAQPTHLKKKRNYFAGARISRLLSDWIVSPLSADKEIRSDIVKLRARARDIAKNSPYIRNYLSLLSANVVGANGIKFQCQLTAKDGTADKYTNKLVEAAWDEFCESVTADGSMSMTQFAALVMRTLATDGEVFIRKVKDDLNSSWFALQLIDADQVDSDYTQPAGKGKNEIRLGVEVDIWHRPVAYHVWNRHLSDENESGRERLRIPADEIIHLFDPDRANQTRGVTWFNSVMVPLRMLEGYVEAELTAARTAAAKMGWLKYTDAAAMTLDGEIPDAPLQFDASPGSIEMLPPGLEFQAWNPDHPSNAYEAYTKNVLRQIASGLRVSYNAFANDLTGVNYSSLRSGLLIERDIWRMLQRLLIDRLYKPVFKDWLAQAKLTGLVPSQVPARVPARWIPRGWQWVDPLKDVNATVIAIQNGLTSRTAALAETGVDFEEVLEQLSSESEQCSEAGVVLGAVAVDAAAALAADAQQQAD